MAIPSDNLKTNYLQMKFFFVVVALFALVQSRGQLPVKWEELSAPDFPEAVGKAAKVCVIPLGIIEKHGPALPLGTDLMIVRDVVLKAAQEEYVVVFPEFFVGQINEARHQPGTIAYSPELVWKMLDETCDEIARNGFEKIILVNGHGGNNSLLAYYSMARLSQKHDYAIYLTNAWDLYINEQQRKLVDDQIQKLPEGSLGHAGADEAAEILLIRPDLFKPEKAESESGENQERLGHLKMVTSGIGWYASYPNHYAGNAAAATTSLGTAMLAATVNGLIKAFREVKADEQVLKLQNLFYDGAGNPMKTNQ